MELLIGGGKKRRREEQCGGEEDEGRGSVECVGRRQNAKRSRIRALSALAATPEGSLFIGDAELIRRLSPDGTFLDTLFRLE